GRAGRDVEVLSVGADRDGLRGLETLYAIHTVALHPHERERARRRIPQEDDERVVRAAGGVDIRPVGTDGNPGGAREARDAVDAGALALDEGEGAGGVAVEDDERVVLGAGGVDVETVGAHRDGGGAAEAFDAGAALLVFLDEGELTRRGVPREDGERAVAAAGGVDVGAVGGDREGLCRAEPVHAGVAVVLGADVGESVCRARGACGEAEKGERPRECANASVHMSAPGSEWLMCHEVGTRSPVTSITVMRGE